jgi:hypothetical protein
MLQVQGRFVGVYAIHFVVSTLSAQPGPNEDYLNFHYFQCFKRHLFHNDSQDEDKLGD